MKNNLDIVCLALEKAKNVGAERADCVMFETTDVNMTQRLSKPEGLERSESKALGLRVFIGDQQAIASSTDVSDAALAELAERVVAMARATPPDPDSTLASESF